jgi:RNA-directed DNA polymerase
VTPRLPREFKDNLRQHLHFLLRPDVGPALHARTKGFASTLGLKHHLQGLVSFARQIEPEYGRICAERLAAVPWPI